jgi:SAM-dependent MidA family methyltransferase
LRPSLLDRIRAEIRGRGPIPFSRFMELALYDADGGYYAAGPERLGPRGDYVTASDVGRWFGRCLARQLGEIDRALGTLAPFAVVELGAGRGLLARDTLDALAELEPDLHRRARFVLVDASAAMREAAAALVPEARVAAPADLGSGYRGAVVAVELFDALPVDRVRRRGRLLEVCVGVDSAGELIERERPARDAVAAWAERYGAAAADGTEAEVCLALDAQVAAIARALDRGVVLIVDYGDEAARLYGPGRERGTLLAYRAHATSEDFLAEPGRRDLTAHVNFTALADSARAHGLDVLGSTTQDRFLIANGILEAFEQRTRSDVHDPRRVKQRLQALALVHPSGMGRAFRVLALSKGCDAAPSRGRFL